MDTPLLGFLRRLPSSRGSSFGFSLVELTHNTAHPCALRTLREDLASSREAHRTNERCLPKKLSANSVSGLGQGFSSWTQHHKPCGAQEETLVSLL